MNRITRLENESHPLSKKWSKKRSMAPVVLALTCAAATSGAEVAADVGAARLWSDTYSIGGGGWQVLNHPRFLGDVDGDGKDDVVGISGAGVELSLSTGSQLRPKCRALNYFGKKWYPRHPRFLADVNGDDKADVVGLSSAGVRVGLAQSSPDCDFGFQLQSGYWNTEFKSAASFDDLQAHPRMMADMSGDGRADIVHFAPDGVKVAISTGASFVVDTDLSRAEFGSSTSAGRWTSSDFRALADIDGDGKSDIVGVRQSHLRVALTGSGEETFTVYFPSDRNPVIGDVNADGRQDVLGFDLGVPFVMLGTGDPQAPLATIDYAWGLDWSQATVYEHADTELDAAQYPRFLADVNGDTAADLVSFGTHGVYVAYAVDSDNDESTDAFAEPKLASSYFSETWDPAEHIRVLADVDGNGRADIVGFGQSGVHVARFHPDLEVFD